MDTQAHGLLRIWQLATQLNVEKKNWLLVDIGLTQTSICIIPQSRPAYYKDLSFGTQSMDVTSKPELALNQNNEMNINDKSDEFISLLAERLTRQISLYGSVNQQQKIEGVWVTGGGACLLAMDEILSQGLGLPIEVLDPLSLLQGKYKKNKQSLEACTSSWQLRFGNSWPSMAKGCTCCMILIYYLGVKKSVRNTNNVSMEWSCWGAGCD